MHKKEDIIYPPRENKSEQSKRLDIKINRLSFIKLFFISIVNY